VSQRDEAIQSAKRSADWANSAIEDMKVSAQQRDEAEAELAELRASTGLRVVQELRTQLAAARVETDAMVERAITAYRKVAAPSLRSALGVSTIRVILTAALTAETAQGEQDAPFDFDDYEASDAVTGAGDR
jgi:hypothetical protein